MGDLAVVDGEDGMGCKVGCEGGMLTTFCLAEVLGVGSVREWPEVRREIS